MPATKTIENRIVSVEVGSVIRLDNTNKLSVERLLPCDWDQAEFRWPNPIEQWREIHAIAIKVVITGRSFVRHGGEYWAKVQIEWVGDGESSTFTSGWLLCDVWNLPHAIV